MFKKTYWFCTPARRAELERRKLNRMFTAYRAQELIADEAQRRATAYTEWLKANGG